MAKSINSLIHKYMQNIFDIIWSVIKPFIAHKLPKTFTFFFNHTADIPQHSLLILICPSNNTFLTSFQFPRSQMTDIILSSLHIWLIHPRHHYFLLEQSARRPCALSPASAFTLSGPAPDLTQLAN